MPALALGVLLATLDPNDYKAEIAEAVQDATGRSLTLNGPLRISRSLWPTIEISDVKLANLPGGTRPDMARAEMIQAELSLPALLWRQVEVTKLILIGPNILFETVNGQPNWVFKTAANAGAAAAAPPGSHLVLNVRDVHVQNGLVTVRTPARTKDVGIRSLDYEQVRDGAPLTVSTVLVYSDNQPFSLRASARPTAGTAGPWLTQLAFAAEGATASAGGTMSLAGDYDLQIQARAGELEKLNALLPEMRLPPLHDATVATHLTNGPVPGDLPVIGTTTLHFGSADLGSRVPGLVLGAVDLALPAAGASATVNAAGALDSQPFTLAGSFGVPVHLDGPARVPIDLTAHVRGVAAADKGDPNGIGSIAVKGTLAARTGRFEGLDAHLALQAPALAAFRHMLSPVLPALGGVALAGRLVVPAEISPMRLEAATLSANEVALAGDMLIGLGRVMILSGKLHASRLDLDALALAFGGGKPPPKPAAGDPGRPVIADTPLDWAILRGPAIDLAVTATDVTLERQLLHSAEMAMTLKGGRLDVSRFQVSLPGGPATLSLTAQAATDDATVDLTLHAPAMPLALLIHASGLPGSANGSIRLDAKLHGVGRSLHGLANTLAGSLSATMAGGSLSNAALLQVMSSPLNALNIAVPEQGRRR